MNPPKNSFFKVQFFIFPLFIIFVFILSNSALPQLAAQPDSSTFYVATSGTDSGSCGTKGSPCKTIHQAIVNSASGDTILVAAGTYTRASSQGDCLESGNTAVVCLSGTHRTIFGGYTTSNWDSADPTNNVTIIDGQNTHRAVQVHGATADAASLHIEGFTIQNGLKQGATSGSDGQTFAFGGGMLVDRGTLEARNLIFKNNSAIGGNTNNDYGGAAAGGGLAVRSNANGVTLENITFENNTVQGGTGNNRGGFGIGGGLFTFEVAITGTDLTFANNQALGGSSSGSGSSGGNNSDAQGGGAAFQTNSTVNFSNISATGNQAVGGDTPNGDAGGAFGGAFFAERSNVTLADLYVAENLSEGGNGNNANSGSSIGFGGGMSTTSSTLNIERATFVDNTASGGNGTVLTGSGSGGGIYYADFTESEDLTLTNVIFGNNVTKLGTTGSTVGGGGGGLFVNSGEAVLTHITVADNEMSSSMQGIGIVAISGSTVDISHSIFSGLNNVNGNAIHAQPGNTVNLDNNLFFNNFVDTGGGGTFTGTGSNQTGNPTFVSPGSPDNDYRINVGSAAIDQAAGSTTSLDVEGQSRNLSGNPDIGADEFNAIVLTAQAFDEVLLISWDGDSDLLPGLDHYEVVVSQSGGANPPNEGPSPIDVGTDSSILLTGLTNGETYTITIEAKNGSNTTIAVSNTGQVFPTDNILYLPLIIR